MTKQDGAVTVHATLVDIGSVSFLEVESLVEETTDVADVTASLLLQGSLLKMDNL